MRSFPLGKLTKSQNPGSNYIERTYTHPEDLDLKISNSIPSSKCVFITFFALIKKAPTEQAPTEITSLGRLSFPNTGGITISSNTLATSSEVRG